MLPVLAAAAVQAPSLPIAFEANTGQFGRTSGVRLASRGDGYLLELRDDGVAVRFWGTRNARVEMRFAGMNRNARWTPEAQSGARSHYLVGGREQWVTNAPQYNRARLSEIYPNIDLVFHGTSGQIEYDFVVKPGANPSVIRYGV